MADSATHAIARPRDSRIFARHAEDWYVEPSWAWERLLQRLDLNRSLLLHDPACGKGTSVRAALAAGYHASGSDIVARWVGGDLPHDRFHVADFRAAITSVAASVILSNPPFKDARDFAETSIAVAQVTCLLLPATWACGDTKARWLAKTPLSHLFFLTPRPSMLPGAGVIPGTKLGGGTKDYAIFVWTRGTSPGAATVGWLHRDGCAA